MGFAKSPRVQLLMGRTLVRLGQADRARELLAAIPEQSREHLAARLALASLAETVEKRIEMLDGLSPAVSSHPDVMTAKIEALLLADRPAKAFAEFADYRSKLTPTEQVDTRIALLGLRALLAEGKIAQARELAAGIADAGGNDDWRRLEILLLLRSNPSEALARLPKLSGEGYLNLMTALAVNAHAGKSCRMVRDRLQKLLSDAPANVMANLAPDRYLAALLCEDKQEAARAKSQLSPFGLADAQVAEALPDASAGTQRKLLAELLAASILSRTGLAPQARTWAFRLLSENPTCGWAAAIASEGETDATRLAEIVNAFTARDALLTIRLRARLARIRGKDDQARKLYEQAASRYPDNPALLLNLGLATEAAGLLPQALLVYRDAWQKHEIALAANNAAYIISLLHHDSPEKLDDAISLAEAAAKAAPGTPAYRDTYGWLAYLRGDFETARRECRAAVALLPHDPEVHCHLGLAEAKSPTGSPRLARWHLQTAIDLARAAGAKMEENRAIFIKLAEEQLAELDAKSSS
jgi:tetratricopeptide (TPR) repeat protein